MKQPWRDEGSRMLREASVLRLFLSQKNKDDQHAAQTFLSRQTDLIVLNRVGSDSVDHKSPFGWLWKNLSAGFHQAIFFDADRDTPAWQSCSCGWRNDW